MTDNDIVIICHKAHIGDIDILQWNHIAAFEQWVYVALSRNGDAAKWQCLIRDKWDKAISLILGTLNMVITPN